MYIRTYIHIYVHTYIHTCIHTYIYTYMHAYIHTHTHAYIHTAHVPASRVLFLCEKNFFGAGGAVDEHNEPLDSHAHRLAWAMTAAVALEASLHAPATCGAGDIEAAFALVRGLEVLGMSVSSGTSTAPWHPRQVPRARTLSSGSIKARLIPIQALLRRALSPLALLRRD